MYQENKTLLTTQQGVWTWKAYPLKVVGSRDLPFYMYEGETSWPSESRLLLSDCSEEGKQELAKINLTFQCKQSLPLFDIQRFSSWHWLLGVTAWILRFIFRSKRARHQKSQETGNRQNDSLEKVLEPEEISNTERYWVRETQRERFLDCQWERRN